jgi:3'(2'), 5'-bisphosphate nucleotidase
MIMVAEGIANFYPRYGLTSEWDTCAAHGVLKGVKMNLVDMNNKELIYNKENILNPFFKTN